MNTQPAMTPKEMHLHSLSVVAFAHATHIRRVRSTDELVIEFHKNEIVRMAVQLESELAA